MEYNFITSARVQKNYIYVVMGMIIGFMIGEGKDLSALSRVDQIILIVGIIFFFIELVLYLKMLFTQIKKGFVKTKHGGKGE